MGRGIALLFHDRGTRRWWVVSRTPRPHFTPGKDPAPILQEAGWAPGPVWTGGKSRPNRDSIPDRPARSSVAIPTELPGPHCTKDTTQLLNCSDILYNNIIYLFTAIGLLPGGSGYFTCKQNMKLVTTRFKSGGLHEKHVVATWNVGNRLSICL